MKVELCNLCERRVSDLNSTKVIIEDYKGISFDFGEVFPNKRKFKGVICDDCLNLLKEKASE